MIEPNKLKVFGISVAILIVLLPGFHFWTAALGKDSFTFMFIMAFFFSLKNIKKNIFLLIISSIFLTLIRPYLTIFILISIVATLLFRNQFKFKFSHIIVGLFSVASLVILLPFFKDFFYLESFDLENLINRTEFYNNQGAKHADGSSSYIDVSNYNLLFKMFAYFFRPLFFDAHSILQLIISFENLFLITLIISWLKSIKFKIFKWYRLLNLIDRIMLFYVLIGWIIMASSMYNLGLASRQKYMFLPVLFILIFKNFNRDVYLKKA